MKIGASLCAATFATSMARLGVCLEVTEKFLNHVSGSVGGIVGVYQRHESLDEMRKAIPRYETWLSVVTLGPPSLRSQL
jgi:hypothetical protein